MTSRKDADGSEAQKVTVEACGGCGYFFASLDLKSVLSLFGEQRLCRTCRQEDA